MNDKESRTLSRIVGKKIDSAIWSNLDGLYQCYLCFTDGTHIELYTNTSGNAIRIATGKSEGTADDIKAWLERDGARYVSHP